MSTSTEISAISTNSRSSMRLTTLTGTAAAGLKGPGADKVGCVASGVGVITAPMAGGVGVITAPAAGTA